MRRLLIACALVLAGLAIHAQETYTPTTPIAQPAIAVYQIDFLRLGWRQGLVEVQVYDNTGQTYFKAYNATTTPTGATLMRNLNTANLSTASLYKRVLLQLQTDGVLPPGSVAGTPQ